MTEQIDSQIKRLTTLLMYADDGALAIALYNHPGIREKVIAELRERLPQHVYDLALSRRNRNPIELIRQLTPSPKDVICLYNLEPAFPEALNYLDLHREALTNMRISIVCWVTEHEYSELVNRAPNFYAFRSDVFDFISAPALSTPQTSDFAVREKERHELTRMLQAGGCVLLTGLGGIGKTTLARETVKELDPHFTGGIAWVDWYITQLSFHDILWTAAMAFLSDNTTRMTKHEQFQRIQEQMHIKPCLLVVDGFENISDRNDMLAWLKKISPPSSVLIISRERVPELPAPTLMLQPLSIEDAVRFFTQQVHGAGRQGDDLTLVRHLCERVGKVPLFIKILASLTVEQPLLELKKSLEKADSVVQVAYTQLSEPARKFLDGLSFLPNGAMENLLETFTEIQDWRTAAAECLRLNLAEYDSERYRLHPDVRRFVLAQQGEGEGAIAWKHRLIMVYINLAGYFSRTNEETKQELTQLRLNLLNAEWPNALEAAEAAYDLHDWAAVFALASFLQEFLWLRGLRSKAEWLSHLAVAASDYSGNPATAGWARRRLGAFYMLDHRWKEAESTLQDSLSLAQNMLDLFQEAEVLYTLVDIYTQQGQLEKAAEFSRRAINIAHKINNETLAFASIEQLGSIYEQMGKLEEATNMYQEAIRGQEKLGDRSRVASILHSLGNIYAKLKQWGKAAKAYQSSLEIFRAFRDREDEAKVLGDQIWVHIEQRQWAEAERIAQRLLEISHVANDRNLEGMALYNLGCLRLHQGELAAGLTLLREAQSAFMESGNQQAQEHIQSLIKRVPT